MCDEERSCRCQEELQTFCIVFTIKREKESHVLIMARDPKDAIDTFRNTVYTNCALGNATLIPTDIDILGVFTEV